MVGWMVGCWWGNTRPTITTQAEKTMVVFCNLDKFAMHSPLARHGQHTHGALLVVVDLDIDNMVDSLVLSTHAVGSVVAIPHPLGIVQATGHSNEV